MKSPRDRCTLYLTTAIVFVFATSQAGATTAAVLRGTTSTTQPSTIRENGVEAAKPRSRAEQVTVPPGGATSFAMRYPEEVKESPPTFATGEQVELAHSLAREVNKRIAWRETKEWNINLTEPAFGDCKSFALTKRHELREHGVPNGALREVIVYAEKYKGKHMVLEMRTPGEIFVLDSLQNDFGKKFYEISAIPASYLVVEYQMWGKPAEWMVPAGAISEKRRERPSLVAMEGMAWVSSPHMAGPTPALAEHLTKHR